MCASQNSENVIVVTSRAKMRNPFKNELFNSNNEKKLDIKSNIKLVSV
jgi:hypothetical protein